MSTIPVDIRAFKGINLVEPPGMIEDDELARCINLDIGRAGQLTKRKGFNILHNGATLGNAPVVLLGHLNNNTHSVLVAKVEGNLYYSANGADWTLISALANVEWGVQYTNKFYFISSTLGVYSWDGPGNAVAALAGSPNGTFATVYKDRLFVLNSKATTGTLNSRLYFSAIADFATWPSTNFIDVAPGNGDFLTCCAVIHDLLLVFKNRTSWALYVQGAPENWTLRNANPEIGCVSKYTPREIEGFLFFVGPRGVYRTDGNLYEDIAESIKPVFAERQVTLTTANIDTAAWYEDRYILMLNPTPSTQQYFVYHLRTGGWTEWVPAGIKPNTFLEVQTSSPQKGLYCGDLNPTGKVFALSTSGYTDGGVQYVCEVDTKEYDFALPAILKRGLWMMLDLAGVANVTIKHFTDIDQLKVVEEFDSASQEQVIQTVPERRAYKLRGPGYFRVWQLKLTVTGSAEFMLYGSTLFTIKKRALTKAAT